MSEKHIPVVNLQTNYLFVFVLFWDISVGLISPSFSHISLVREATQVPSCTVLEGIKHCGSTLWNRLPGSCLLDSLGECFIKEVGFQPCCEDGEGKQDSS